MVSELLRVSFWKGTKKTSGNLVSGREQRNSRRGSNRLPWSLDGFLLAGPPAKASEPKEAKETKAKEAKEAKEDKKQKKSTSRRRRAGRSSQKLTVASRRLCIGRLVTISYRI